MKTYHVDFGIEVESDSAAEAVARAWNLLTAPGAFRPVGIALELDSGDREEIDLEPTRFVQDSPDHCSQCGAKNDDGEGPDGAEICQDCFAAGAH